MYTQCPECKQPKKINASELSSIRGMISCKQCSAMYDALELLAEGAIPEQLDEVADFPEIDPQTKKRFTNWGLATSLGLGFLCAQIYYFESHKLTQNSAFRPWLEKICQPLECQLPVYSNLEEFTILHGSFQSLSNKIYSFKTSFVNQSSFAQNLPSIKLTFIDFTGYDFAERIFLPNEYSNQPLNVIKSEMSAEIIMEIVAPSQKIGGYRFEFI